MRHAWSLLLVLAFAPPVQAQSEEPSEYESEETLAEISEAPEPPPLDVRTIVNEALEARKAELSGSAYPFCTDQDFEPDSFQTERFCKMVGPEMKAICPAAERICYEEPEKSPFRLPDGVVYTLLTLALLLLVAGLSWFVITLMRQWRVRDVVPLDLQGPAPVQVSLQVLPDAQANVLLKEAEIRLAAGQLGEAALVLHVAALRYFEDTGLIRFHASTTNGEYLRVLRPHPSAASLFRGIAGLTDRVRFGDGQVEREALEILIGQARSEFARTGPSSPGVVGVAAGFILLAFVSACDGRSTSFYSHRPEGLAALPALLERAGIETEVVRRRPTDIAPSVGLVFIRTDYMERDPTTAEIDELLDDDQAVIILDDAHRATALLPVTSTVSHADLVAKPPSVELEITDEYFCRFDQAEFREAEFDSRPGTFSMPAGFALVISAEPAPASGLDQAFELLPLIRYPEAGLLSAKLAAIGALRLDPQGEYQPGCLAVFASSELFSNAALTQEKNTAYAIGLVASLLQSGESVLFIDSLGQGQAGGGAVSDSMANTRMLPLVLHAGLWVAVLFVALGAAFGRLRDPIRTEHKSFMEHAQAVGLYYAASGEAGLVHSAESLARLVVARYRHQFRGGSEQAWTALAQHLAERHQLDRQDVLSALSSGLEKAVQLKLGIEANRLSPTRTLEILSSILAGEAHADQKKKKVR